MAYFPTLIGKIRDELRIVPEDGFPTLGKTHYFALLQELHQKLQPDVYLEIGSESGASLSLATCLTFAVDPNFQIEADVMGRKPGLILQQCTSDDFFASGLLERLGVKIDLAFLDGMHLFEYLLADFTNTERNMSSDGVILMHDCVPFSAAGARRDWDRRATRSWTGDVWKLLPILREYRPDLTIVTHDTPPSGLVMVTGLNPSDRVLEEKRDEILSRFNDMEFEDLGSNTFADAANIVPYARHVVPPSAQGQLSFRIQTPVPRPRAQAAWGDHAFAVSLAGALERAGHKAEIKTVRDWYQNGPADQIDIVLRGDTPYQRRYGHLTFMWALYVNDIGELRQSALSADHVFAAGQPLVDDLVNIYGADTVSLLPQAFDASLMKPLEADATREGATFVGISKRFRRPIVRQALRAGLPLQLWGRGWADSPAAKFAKGERLDQMELGAVYASSEIVLNDHRADMARFGIPSNRIFDALACATPVITDPVAWLPEDLAPFVHQVNDARGVQQAAAAIGSEDATRKHERRALALQMRDRHSFDARAAEIIAKARQFTEYSVARETA
ncbi:MAG: glycosyltransferase family protein [Paracoccaceae bacterium]